MDSLLTSTTSWSFLLCDFISLNILTTTANEKKRATKLAKKTNILKRSIATTIKVSPITVIAPTIERRIAISLPIISPPNIGFALKQGFILRDSLVRYLRFGQVLFQLRLHPLRYLRLKILKVQIR